MTSTKKLLFCMIISLEFLLVMLARCPHCLQASANISFAGDFEEGILRRDDTSDVLILFQKGIWLKEAEYSANLQHRIDSSGVSWGLSQAGNGTDPRAYRSTDKYGPKYFDLANTHIHEMASTPGVGRWAMQLGSAILAVLSMGIEDVVLIAPFTIGSRKWFNMFVYFVCMELVGLAAWCFNSSADAFEAKHPNVNMNLICKIGTSILLTSFFIFLLCESLYQDTDESDVEDADDATAPAEDTLLSKKDEDSDKSISDKSIESVEQKYTLSALIVISLLGNLDNFALYIAVLQNNAFSGLQLTIGIAIGTLIIGLLSLSATQFSFVVQLFEYVPLWVIIGILCIWCYVGVVQELQS